MRSQSRFKLLGVAAVLVALLTALGGLAPDFVLRALAISQAAGGQSGIQATVYDDAVRFVVQNEQVALLRASARGIARDGNIPWARVFNLSGKRLYDSGPVMGNALDWNMSTEAGERAAHGVYLSVITAWDSQGQLVKSQVGKRMLSKELSYILFQI